MITKRHIAGLMVGGTLVSLAALSGGGSSLAHAAPPECRDIPFKYGDENHVVRMCKGPDGKWQEVSQSVSDERYGSAPETTETAAAPEQDARAEVEYRGTFEQTISYPSDQGINPSNILGSLLNNALNKRVEHFQGAYVVNAQLNGAASTATFSGPGLQTIDTSGTASRGYCRLFGQTEAGTTLKFEGQCSARGFSGTMSGRSSSGVEVKGRFETTTTKYVDIAERNRQQAAAKVEAERIAATARAEQDRNAAAAAAELAARPNASPALVALLEAAVKQDSGAWIFNRYRSGSVHNVKIVQSKPTVRLRGEFDYRNGSSGWVEADILKGKVSCLAYWDAGGCEEVRSAASYADQETNSENVLTKVNLKDPKDCLVSETFLNGRKERNDAVFYGTTNYVQRYGRSITNRCTYTVSFEVFTGGLFGFESETLGPGDSTSCEDDSQCGITRVVKVK